MTYLKYLMTVVYFNTDIREKKAFRFRGGYCLWSSY